MKLDSASESWELSKQIHFPIIKNINREKLFLEKHVQDFHTLRTGRGISIGDNVEIKEFCTIIAFVW